MLWSVDLTGAIPFDFGNEILPPDPSVLSLNSKRAPRLQPYHPDHNPWTTHNPPPSHHHPLPPTVPDQKNTISNSGVTPHDTPHDTPLPLRDFTLPQRQPPIDSNKNTQQKKPSNKKKSRKRKANTLPAAGTSVKKAQTEAEIQEEKRKQRLVRNRASAQLSRDRKKAHLANLERKVLELTSENARLNEQVASLTAELIRYRQRPSDPSISPLYLSPSSEYDSDSTFSTGSLSPKRLSSGLVLFAFVFAFGLFFQWSGVDVGTSYQYHHSGRALTSYNPQPIMDWSVVPKNPKEGSPKGPIVDLNVDRLASYETDNADNNLAISPYQGHYPDGYGDLQKLYEKLLWANESIEANVSYFFVPSLLSMFDSSSSANDYHYSSSSAPPSKVAGFLPESDNSSHKSDKLIDIISVGDHLYFWTPAAASAWDAEGSFGTNRHRKSQAQRDHTMYEIHCEVGGARALPFTLFKS